MGLCGQLAKKLEFAGDAVQIYFLGHDALRLVEDSTRWHLLTAEEFNGLRLVDLRMTLATLTEEMAGGCWLLRVQQQV